jgi:hypothetical protein
MCITASAGNRPARAWVWTLIILLILMPIVGIVIYRITGDRMLQERLDGLAAREQPITLQELTESYSLPPGVENAADLYLEAFDSLVKWQDKDLLKDLPLIGEAALPPRNEPLPAIMKERIGQYLQDNQVVLDILHQAAAMSHCRYPRDFSQGFDMEMTWLSKLRQCAFLLKLEAIHNIETGQRDSAVRSVQSGMALGQSIYPPVLVEQLVRIAVMALNIQTLEYLLNRTPLSDSSLQTLSEALQAENPRASLGVAIQGERCMGIAIFRGATAGDSLGAGNSGKTARMLGPLRAVGYLQRDAAGYLDLMQVFLDNLERPTAEGLQHADSLALEAYGGMFTGILAPALERIMELAVRAEAQQQLALTALAVERFRLAQGQLPERLEQLAPDRLETAPMDPFDGIPLRYRQFNPGYVVYSIGTDRTDDGGKERVKQSDKEETWDITFIVERE